MAFEQAAIKVEKAQEFSALQGAIDQAFLPDKVERFLKELDRKGIRIRDLDLIIAKGALEGCGEAKMDSQKLYQALPVSDQAQVREYYLSKLEAVDVALRHKFRKLYQYY